LVGLNAVCCVVKVTMCVGKGPGGAGHGASCHRLTRGSNVSTLMAGSGSQSNRECGPDAKRPARNFLKSGLRRYDAKWSSAAR
jgi:hypothetical protein